MSHVLKALFFVSILVLSGSTLPFALAQNATMILSPLKQLKNGISPQDVKCEQGFLLVIKTSDASPACVRQQTAQKLIERGWGTRIDQTAWFKFNPIQCHSPWDEYWHRTYGNFTFAPYTDAVIGSYFKSNGIILLEARELLVPSNKSPPQCGESSYSTFYFLVPQSDVQKMTELGYTLVEEKEVCSIKLTGCRIP